jgi:hypothetical protein
VAKFLPLSLTWTRILWIRLNSIRNGFICLTI